MTLSQLRTFALVARLGSMRAAAGVLGVSEPAVSAAIAALRTDLGDALVVRAEGGIALTAGGRRLAAHADEIVGLADRARREVTAAGTFGDSLRVVATAAFEEHAAAALIDAFTRRSPGTAVELGCERAERLTAALVDRSADIVLGLRPATVGDVTLDVVPFLRYQRIVVAGPAFRRTDHPMPMAELAAQRWLTGPEGIEERSAEGRWLAGSPVLTDLVAMSSEAEALAAVLAGDGVMLALRHVVREHLRHGALVRVPASGTPVQGLWCASTLGHRRATPGARALQRFATTPDATAAMVGSSLPAAGSLRRARPVPPVHVTLWS